MHGTAYVGWAARCTDTKTHIVAVQDHEVDQCIAWDDVMVWTEILEIPR